MKLNTFKLEEYLGKYEFSAPYLLCCSDAETFSQKEIIALANTEHKELWDNLFLGYTEVQGFPLLREQIAQSLYPNLQAKNIFCFAGAEEGIFCTLFTLCNPEDHVIVLTPCYQSLVEIPRFKGAHVEEIVLQEHNNWRIDITAIAKAITPKTTCIIVNFPHNPTGQVITPQEMSDLVDLCKKNNLWLFSDEVYRLLGNPSSGWAAPAATLYPKAISLGVMSKAFGLAGLRIGWIACQDTKILEDIARIKHYTSICSSAPSETLSLIALTNMDTILKRNNQIVHDNLILIDQFMKKHNDIFTWVKPQGGCTGFVKYHGPEPIDQLAKELIEKIGVLILPGSIYNHTGNYFRIGFGRKNMPQALQLLDNFIAHKYKKK